jgi:HAD superfamily hydrolase (TIGR01509 family)
MPKRGADAWPAAAIFDFDGLIVDTALCWRTAYTRVLGRHGRQLDPGQPATLLGASVREAARWLGVAPEEVHHELRSAVAQADLHALPGVRTLLDRLRGQMRLAVATNGPRDVVVSALRRLQLGASFDAVVSAESLPLDKPAPDVYLAACREVRVDPCEAVALEDSAIGVTAARNAGLTVIQVAHGAAGPSGADLQLARLDDPELFAFLGLGQPRRACDATRAEASSDA